MANEKKYVLNESDLQEMANYLAGRPYREVAALIGKLAQLKPVVETPTPSAPAAKPLDSTPN